MKKTIAGTATTAPILRQGVRLRLVRHLRERTACAVGIWLAAAALAMAAGADAAGPRLGPIARVEVSVPDRAELDRLVAGGYDVDNVLGGVASVYATTGEVARLTAEGFLARVVEEPGLRVPESYPPPAAQTLGTYHDYAGLTSFLQTLAATHTNLCRLVSAGTSVQGRQLLALRIGDNPDRDEDEPEVRYIGSMHGDEPLGMEMCLYFIDRLLSQYGSDPRITAFVDATDVWIVPLMNPDGLAANSRFNTNGYDLNRSFPEGSLSPLGDPLNGPLMSTNGRQREVACVMDWTAAHRFVLAANLHGGTLVVNYPYDNDGKGSVDSPTPDDALFEQLSRTYATNNPPMFASAAFPGGIVNGAAWYAVNGGMQDWGYRYLGCMEVTIELSSNKKPAASQLPQFWSDNRESMLAFLENAQRGVRGLVRDADTEEPVFASVRVAGNSRLVYTDPDVGDYHRVLLPGSYGLVVAAPGYATGTVSAVSVGAGAATRADVWLARTVRPDHDGDGQPDGADPDDDNDGMPDAWEVAHGLDRFESADAHADADGDGSDNLSEFLAGTGPCDAGSALRIVSLRGQADWTVRWSSASGRTYRVGRSGSVLAGFVDLPGVVTSTPPVNTLTDTPPAGMPGVFYRVRLAP